MESANGGRVQEKGDSHTIEAERRRVVRAAFPPSMPSLLWAFRRRNSGSPGLARGPLGTVDPIGRRIDRSELPPPEPFLLWAFRDNNHGVAGSRLGGAFRVGARAGLC